MKNITVLFFWCVFALFLAVKHWDKIKNNSHAPTAPQSGQADTRKGKSEDQKPQSGLLDLHNKERKAKGYAPLVLDKSLCDYAQKHAAKMAKNNSLEHSSMSKLQEVSQDSSFVGENIAWGQESEASVVEAWMWSPGHRWNILGSKYKKVGFGLEKDKNGKIYWCAVFSD
jgi:uncharacterized protein YkwD